MENVNFLTHATIKLLKFFSETFPNLNQPDPGHRQFKTKQTAAAL